MLGTPKPGCPFPIFNWNDALATGNAASAEPSAAPTDGFDGLALTAIGQLPRYGSWNLAFQDRPKQPRLEMVA